MGKSKAEVKWEKFGGNGNSPVGFTAFRTLNGGEMYPESSLCLQIRPGFVIIGLAGHP